MWCLSNCRFSPVSALCVEVRVAAIDRGVSSSPPSMEVPSLDVRTLSMLYPFLTWQASKGGNVNGQPSLLWSYKHTLSFSASPEWLMKESPSFAISVFSFYCSFNKMKEWPSASSAVDDAIVSTASRSALAEVRDWNNMFYRSNSHVFQAFIVVRRKIGTFSWL